MCLQVGLGTVYYKFWNCNTGEILRAISILLYIMVSLTTSDLELVAQPIGCEVCSVTELRCFVALVAVSCECEICCTNMMYVLDFRFNIVIHKQSSYIKGIC